MRRFLETTTAAGVVAVATMVSTLMVFDVRATAQGTGVDDAAGPTAPPTLPVVVGDPRGGDLRFDDDADVIPADYEPTGVAGVESDVAYGPDPSHRLDLYRPALAGAAPVVAFLHAGGWVAGDKTNVPDMVLRFVERGYAVASIGYRLAPDHPFPAPVDDIRAALRFLRSRSADDETIDGGRIVLYGASAGGHLATLVAATTAPGSGVSGVVSVVGPVDLVDFYRNDHPWAAGLTEAFLGCSPCRDHVLASASPVSHLHDDLPPAYFAYGAADSLVAADTQGVSIATAWAAAGGGGAWLDVVDDLGHNLDGSTVNQRAIEEFVDEAFAAARR